MHIATKEACIDVLRFLFQMGANKNALVSVCMYLCICYCSVVVVVIDFVYVWVCVHM